MNLACESWQMTPFLLPGRHRDWCGAPATLPCLLQPLSVDSLRLQWINYKLLIKHDLFHNGCGTSTQPASARLQGGDILSSTVGTVRRIQSSYTHGGLEIAYRHYMRFYSGAFTSTSVSLLLQTDRAPILSQSERVMTVPWEEWRYAREGTDNIVAFFIFVLARPRA